MRPRVASLVILAAAAAALAGCGEQAAAPAAPGDLVLLRAGAERTLALGAGSPRALPAGQPAAGWRSLYTATPTRRRHHRRARRRAPRGARWARCAFPGAGRCPATVIGGAPDAATADGRDARPRARGRARDTLRPGRRVAAPGAAHVTLPGRFAFDAIAPDARRMFLIEQRPGGHYLVRDYDLAARRAACPAPSSTSARPDEPMEGRPVARATPAAGPWVYTLYRKAAGPFVHALNTEGFALCLDLPAAARSGPAAAGEWGLVLGPGDGDALRRQPRARPRRRDRRREPGVRAHGAGSPAARSARRRGWRSRPTAGTLYVPTAGGVVAVDTSAMQVRRTLLPGHRVSAVVASGRRLYAQDGAVVALDAASGAVLQRTPTSAPPAALAAVVPAG